MNKYQLVINVEADSEKGADKILEFMMESAMQNGYEDQVHSGVIMLKEQDEIAEGDKTVFITEDLMVGIDNGRYFVEIDDSEEQLAQKYISKEKVEEMISELQELIK